MSCKRETAIPIDAHPDPVLRYAITNGTPVVIATNASFERAFEPLQDEPPVSVVLDRFDTAEPPDCDDSLAELLRGDTTRTYLDGSGTADAYLARAIPLDDGGFLTFTPLDNGLDVAETVDAGQVASVLSHDLRNPLDVANAHLRAARETGDSEHFDAVDDAHDRMERIIRDVLTLARGPDAVNPSERTSIERAAEDAWQSVDTERATLEVADTLPTVTADSDRIRRLFENLFRNAVEHAGDAVTVRVGALDSGGFFVADDGRGIPFEDRDTVFTPGYSTEGTGTGLGLAIVDRIATAHEWNVRLTTARDGGARVEVEW